MVKSVLVFALAAALSGSAAAATVTPKTLDAVAFIAGHPVQVVCDPALDGHANDAGPGFTVIAWTPYGGDVIYAQPSLCDETGLPVGSRLFAHAIGTFIHEASHARGVRSESCAEMTADIGVFDVLQRFYAVPFFSPLSRRVGGQVLQFTLQRSAAYQPSGCWLSVYR